MRNVQRGNILFLILLAVVLFAALTYAVTGSQKGQVKDVSSEKADTLAATILQTGSLTENAINRLKLVNGCADTQISFDSPTVSGYYYAASPADKHCYVYDPAGAGLSFPQPPPELGNVQYWFNGRTKWLKAGAAAGASLVMALPINSAALCAAINKALGNPATLAVDWIDSTKFKGGYSPNNGFPDDGGNMTGYELKTIGCLQTYTGNQTYYDQVGAPYFYYHVLILR